MSNIMLHEDKDYKPVDKTNPISLSSILKINAISPLKKRDLDICILYFLHNKTQTDIADIIGGTYTQASIYYILKATISKHVVRTLDLIDIIPELLEIYEKLDISQKLRYMVTLSIYRGNVNQFQKDNPKITSIAYFVKKFRVLLQYHYPESKTLKYMNTHLYNAKTRSDINIPRPTRRKKRKDAGVSRPHRRKVKK
jgi:hypothetical protein